MPVAILDMIVIGVLLVSGLLAMLRGFTREVLAIASWAVAALCAYLFYKQLVPFFLQNVIANEKIATPAAAATIFLGALIVAYFVTAKLSDVILDSRIGALDRTLGFIFGLARGFLLMVVAFGLFEKLVGEICGSVEQPALADFPRQLDLRARHTDSCGRLLDGR